MLKIFSRKYIFYVAVILLLIFLHLTKVLWPVESFFLKILNPIGGELYSLSAYFRGFYQTNNSEDLAAQVRLLKEENNDLIVDDAKIKLLEEENKVLRQQLKFFTKNKYNYVLANVVAKGNLINSDVGTPIFSIDKGKADGLVSGLAVVSPNIYGDGSQGIIIGKVTEVKDNLAQVLIITNPNCKLAAAVNGQSQTMGIARGELGLSVKMEFIPQNAELKLDDLIMTSGLEQNIPRGLVIGKINQVIKESNELWQSAVVEPLINLDELTIVAVLLP